MTTTPDGDGLTLPDQIGCEFAGATNVPFDLIIFDCDGVLVDSEVISCQAHARVLSRHGYAITAEEVFQRFLGRSTRQANLEVEAELGRGLPDDYHTDLRDDLHRSFATDLEAIPHIAAALDRIVQPVCVASSGSHERMRVSLGRAGLYDRFAPHIFSASQVRHGKPAPDLFLYTARRLTTAPNRCLVVEDSPAGIAAAVAAGMTAIGFSGGSHCGPEHGSRLQARGTALVIADMRELATAIAKLG